jgi:hypothetical protein
MARTLVFLLVLATAACVQTKDATPHGIWLQEPLISFGDPDRVAADHCARYGKKAVRQGQMGGSSSSYLPVLAYDCR